MSRQSQHSVAYPRSCRRSWLVLEARSRVPSASNSTGCRSCFGPVWSSEFRGVEVCANSKVLGWVTAQGTASISTAVCYILFAKSSIWGLSLPEIVIVKARPCPKTYF